MQDWLQRQIPTISEVHDEIKRRIIEGGDAAILMPALEKLTAAQGSKFLGIEPLDFVSRILGRPLWSKQAEILQSVKDNARTAVRSCHGIGKTYTAAAAILWFLYAHPKAIILSTAPTWRQVEKLIWKEIRTAFNNALVPLKGNLAPKAPELNLITSEWYAAGISTNQPERFQGFHEKHILVVADEAAGVSEEIFEAIEGALTSSGARLLLLGNPTQIGGAFYDAFKPASQYNKIHISAFDTPNFTQFGITLQQIIDGTYKCEGELPYPRLITPDWVRSRYLEWGLESPAWYSRILGEFPQQGEDTLIPLHWIIAANERWKDSRATKNSYKQIGVDVAAFGSDRTVIVQRRGVRVEKIDIYTKQSTMETAGLVKLAHQEYQPDLICVDSIGIGQGVVDALAEQGIKNTGVNVADKAKEPDRFANLRAELWWHLRELLNPENEEAIALPENDALLAELSAIKYKINHTGKIQIEAKDEMKKRLGRSPDIADAVVLAFANIKRHKSFVISGGTTYAASIKW